MEVGVDVRSPSRRRMHSRMGGVVRYGGNGPVDGSKRFQVSLDPETRRIQAVAEFRQSVAMNEM